MKKIKTNKIYTKIEEIESKIDYIILGCITLLVTILCSDVLKEIFIINNKLRLSDLLIIFAGIFYFAYLFKMYYKPKNN